MNFTKREVKGEISACFERLWDLDQQLTVALRDRDQDSITDLQASISTVMSYQIECSEYLNYLLRTKAS